VSKDITTHIINLRREKMQRLHKELGEIGASFEVPDIDPRQLDGIRRLRLLHANASKLKAPISGKTIDSGIAMTNSKETRTHVKPEDRKFEKSFVTTSGLFGLSIGVTIGIFVGSAVLIVLVAYVAYKYATWRPKMIARKGYKAVSKSKGLLVSESDGGYESAPTPSRQQVAPSIIVAGSSR